MPRKKDEVRFQLCSCLLTDHFRNGYGQRYFLPCDNGRRFYRKTAGGIPTKTIKSHPKHVYRALYMVDFAIKPCTNTHRYSDIQPETASFVLSARNASVFVKPYRSINFAYSVFFSTLKRVYNGHAFDGPVRKRYRHVLLYVMFVFCKSFLAAAESPEIYKIKTQSLLLKTPL